MWDEKRIQNKNESLGQEQEDLIRNSDQEEGFGEEKDKF